jgi:hypothetical protein
MDAWRSPSRQDQIEPPPCEKLFWLVFALLTLLAAMLLFLAVNDGLIPWIPKP